MHFSVRCGPLDCARLQLSVLSSTRMNDDAAFELLDTSLFPSENKVYQKIVSAYGAPWGLRVVDGAAR